MAHNFLYLLLLVTVWCALDIFSTTAKVFYYEVL
jgi:hypothetical protein